MVIKNFQFQFQTISFAYMLLQVIIKNIQLTELTHSGEYTKKRKRKTKI